MPNDAKLGLVLGVSLVVVIGLVFFRAEPRADGQQPPTTSVHTVVDTHSQQTPQPFPN
jgi:hypothetical protein